jgi:hypothetical protein
MLRVKCVQLHESVNNNIGPHLIGEEKTSRLRIPQMYLVKYFEKYKNCV